MSLIPENPSKGDTFTNPETAVEYTFDGVKWLASGGEELGITEFDDRYVKQSDSWDMKLGTSLGVNVLKPLEGGTPFIYYEPRDYNNTHPCGILNRGLMENYVGEEIAKVSSSEPELPKFKLVAGDYSDWGNGSFAALDSSGYNTNSIDSTRAIIVSSFDVDGKRWGRDEGCIEYGRSFSGHCNVTSEDGDKTIFTMSPHYNAKCQMAYWPGTEESPHSGYLIAWQGLLSHTVTSDESDWKIGSFYRFSIPEIFF